MSRDVQDAIGSRYPWLAAELESTAAGVFQDAWVLPQPPDVVWPVVSDTSRLNRTLHVPIAAFDEVQGQRRGTTRYFRLEFSWTEPPWEWVAERLVVCRKVFERGPVRSVLAVMMLEPDGEGTRFTVWYGWVPRGLMGPLVVRRIGAYLRKSYEELIPEMTHWLAGPRTPDTSPLVRLRKKRAPDAEIRAENARRTLLLRGIEPDVTDGLIQHVLHADAMDLDRIRPFALADALGLPRERVLDAALIGTSAGLLLARWDVVCPHCRGTRSSHVSLDDIASKHTCEACDVAFPTTSERLELTFRVHEAVRHVEPRVYCAAEAALKPHVRVQVHPREPRTVELSLRPGRYLLRTSDFLVNHRIEVSADGPEQAQVSKHSGDGAIELSSAGRLALPAIRGTWVLEAVEPLLDATRPAHALSRAAYREVMGEETLGPDIALEMGTQTLLFTDVVGSTVLYRTLGDTAAFTAVRQHFAAVFAHVRAEGGAVIKTIGDSVMAAFTTPEAALRAAENIASADLTPTQVRVSLHDGPCIAVNLDTGMDYFGSTVNEAAKLQGAAGAGEIAVSEELAARLGLEGRSVPYVSGDRNQTATVWSPLQD